MLDTASKGLSGVRNIYLERTRRVLGLQKEGKKVIGYLCIYPVIEMLTAFNIVPYRIFGDMKEPITKADTYLPTIVCPFLRSLLDLGLKGRYEFLDGVIMAHICDVGAQMQGLWNSFVGTPYSYFIDTPHTTHEASQQREKDEIRDFIKSLEILTGKAISQEKLKEAIVEHNEQRALVRELYELRKPDSPLISGTEVLQVLVAGMSLPVNEGSRLFREVIDEVKGRKDGPQKKKARLLIWGPVIHETPLIEMIESLDADVVMDDTCVGSRAYFDDVKLTDDPLDGLAYHYLVELKCPRTFRETTVGEMRKDYKADLENRYGYLGKFAKDWNVDGVILQSVRFCDSHGYEVPAVKDYLTSIGLPSIYLEHDNTEGALAQLRTRVQGFLEIIG
ncbi:2-hydroxyacyl-CoA dehydratase subunit D [Chloroflexota bacterium]